jgi:hypothetical protein
MANFEGSFPKSTNFFIRASSSTDAWGSNGVFIRESITHEFDCVLDIKGSGNIKISATDGKVFLGNGPKDMGALLIGLIDEIKAIAIAGSPAAQTVNPVTQQKLEAYKNKSKELFLESA